MIINPSLPDKVNIPNAVLFQNIGDEYVLLHTQTEQYFGLDEVGARFWQLFSDGSNTRMAVDAVLAEFEVDQQTLEKDLIALLQKLENYQLVTF